MTERTNDVARKKKTNSRRKQHPAKKRPAARIEIPERAHKKLEALVQQRNQANAELASHIDTTYAALNVPDGYLISPDLKAFVKPEEKE
ncbi:MAG: hypothetical protein DHS20C21_18100 [Gemmatimonadota bacterium]|nr:MAG: hypothetical protein DHS20C21_18100 [Gemmatimonadota bacterium]